MNKKWTKVFPHEMEGVNRAIAKTFSQTEDDNNEQQLWWRPRPKLQYFLGQVAKCFCFLANDTYKERGHGIVWRGIEPTTH